MFVSVTFYSGRQPAKANQWRRSRPARRPLDATMGPHCSRGRESKVLEPVHGGEATELSAALVGFNHKNVGKMYFLDLNSNSKQVKLDLVTDGISPSEFFSRLWNIPREGVSGSAPLRFSSRKHS